MLVSAPATSALDALFASLAPALSGESLKTPATGAFKNVLDDLALLSEPEADASAKQQSAAVPEPSSKKQQPQASASLTDIVAAPQTAALKLPQARFASPQAGSDTPADENTAGDAETSQSPAGDSAPANLLHSQPATIETLPQAGPLEAEETPVHATAPAPRAAIPSGSSSSTKVAASTVFGHTVANVSSRAASAPAAIRTASQPRALLANAPASQPVMTPDAGDDEQTPAASVAAAPSQVPVKAPISNPPTMARPAQQAATGKPSATPPIDPGKHYVIDPDKSGSIVTTRSAKNSPPSKPSSPVAPGQPAGANTTPAASSTTRPAILPGAMATLPVPANHEVPSANANPIGTPTASSIAPSQQPAKPHTSDSAPQTRPAPQIPASTSGLTAPSSTPEFLTAPVPAAPTVGQSLQAQAAPTAETPSSGTPNPDQSAEAQAMALPGSPVTSMPATSTPATAPAPTGISQPAAGRTTQPAGPSITRSETPGSAPEAKSPLVPQAENFAFAMRLLGLDDEASRAPLTQSSTSPGNGDPTSAQPNQTAPQPQNSPAQQTAPPQGQSANPQDANPSQQNSSQATHETQPAAPTTGKPEPAAQSQPEISAASKAAEPSHPVDAPVFQVPQQGPQAESPASGLERGDAAEPQVMLAAQQMHSGGPELPRSSASSEILLHLTGSDQSTAAIRVADRAGSVNVSVHAADPVLRESLRTNLGDLSAQLNLQGWKTDTTKSAAVASHSDNPQDSHGSEQRGSGQQSSGGDRQPQRERRGNGGQWQEAFNQQITGKETHPGGNR